MTKAYFKSRLIEAQSLAKQAVNANERSAYLRAARIYRDLLGLNRLHPPPAEGMAEEP